jgi:hypothetical protein
VAHPWFAPFDWELLHSGRFQPKPLAISDSFAAQHEKRILDLVGDRTGGGSHGSPTLVSAFEAKIDDPHSNFAFNSKLRPYKMEREMLFVDPRDNEMELREANAIFKDF